MFITKEEILTCVPALTRVARALSSEKGTDQDWVDLFQDGLKPYGGAILRALLKGAFYTSLP